MTLLETQRRLAAALMTPLTAKDRIARRTPSGVAMAKEAAAFIKPNSRLTAVERLEIYSRSYWFRLLDSFRDDFPGLAAVLGPAAFERLARAYLADCPSRSFTLRDLGSRLEDWLREHPGYGAGNPELALDMARLEWAHIVAFDGPAEKVLGPEDLAELKPGLRVGVQPYISLLDLHYPVDEIRVRSGGERECSTAASNAAPRRARRPMAKVVQPRPDPIYLAVHRVDLSVYYRRSSVEEFRILTALRGGRSIAAAIRGALADSSIPPEDVPERLRLWFATWTQLGWLTVRCKQSGGLRP